MSARFSKLVKYQRTLSSLYCCYWLSVDSQNTMWSLPYPKRPVQESHATSSSVSRKTTRTLYSLLSLMWISYTHTHKHFPGSCHTFHIAPISGYAIQPPNILHASSSSTTVLGKGSILHHTNLAVYFTMMGIPVQWKANGKRHLLPFRRWYPTANCKGKISACQLFIE